MNSLPGLPSFLSPSPTPPPFGGYNPSLHGNGLSIFGNMGMLGSLFDAQLNKAIAGFTRGQGMFPGMFNPTQNFYDQYLAQQMAAAQMAAASHGAENDVNRISEIFGGAYTIATGKQAGKAEQDNFRSVASSTLPTILPLLAAANPAAVDSMFGMRGSSSMFNMGFAQAARIMPGPGGMMGEYHLDPNKHETLGKMGAQIFKDLYADNGAGMRGIGGASAGQMLSQMAQRGYLGEMDMPTQNANGTFNTERIVGRMKEMSGAVAAMRDLFGDMGRGNAPISEIFDTLEKITQGGMHKFTPDKVRQMVRDTQQLAKMTGMGIDQIGAMQGEAAAGLRSLGADGTTANAVTQRAVEFGAAYNQLSGGVRSQGKLSTEQMMAYDQRLTMAASSVKTSAVTNQIGALMRLGDQGVIKPGTPAYEMYERLKAGDSSAVQYLTPAQFSGMLMQSGVSAGTAQASLMQSRSNQQYVDKHQVGNMVRDRQFDLDLGPKLQQMFGVSVASAFGGRINGNTAGYLGALMNKAMFGKGMTQEILHDDGRRTEYIVNQMYAGLSEAQKRELGNNPEAIKDRLREAVSAGTANMESQTGQSAATLVSAHGEQMKERRQFISRQKRMHANIADAMGSLGIGKPMQRLMDAIANGKDPEKIAAEMLGGNEKAAAFLKEHKDQFSALAQGQSRATEIANEITRIENDNTIPPNQKAAMLHGLRQSLNDVNAQNRKIVYGEDGKGGLSAGLEKAGVTAAQMTADKEKAMKKLIGDKGDLSGEVEKIDKVRERIKKDLAKRLGVDESALTAEQIEKAEKEAVDSGQIGMDPSGLGLDPEKVKLMREKGLSLGEVSSKMKETHKEREAKKQILTGTLKIVGNSGSLDASMVPSLGGGGAGSTSTGNTSNPEPS